MHQQDSGYSIHLAAWLKEINRDRARERDSEHVPLKRFSKEAFPY
jgi:hypothetical protein